MQAGEHSHRGWIYTGRVAMVFDGSSFRRFLVSLFDNSLSF